MNHIKPLKYLYIIHLRKKNEAMENKSSEQAQQ